MARSIQQASLPKEVPQLEGWQIAPYYQPAREVGGDFYDFFELEGGKVGLAVGDATGKGMPAALAVTASSSMLRAVAQDSSYSPGEVLGRVNETLLARIPQNMFVTCFYAILEPESGSLTYANAGHDLPYLWHSGECEELRARGMPLGLMPGMRYEEKETVLQGATAPSSTLTAWLRPATRKERCSAFRACRRSCPSSLRRRARWGRHYSRSSTPS